MTKRIAFTTLGCKLNQYETDSLATQFTNAGYSIVDSEQSADAYIINTCTVTNKSDRKSRNTINRAAARTLPILVDAGSEAARALPPQGDDGILLAEAARSRSGRPVVVVTGCFVDSNRAYLESRRDLTYVVDNERKSQIFHIVDAHFRGEILDPDALPARLFDYQLADKGFHTRSMVKIQDGCDNFCTFCIIPFVRGRATSRPVDEVLDNVRRLVDSGSREIVLTGVNMGRYASGGVDFSGVVERILELPGRFRVRISSLEPEPLGDRFIELLGHPKMCPHLHLCLQSGSERVLLQMRRMYTVASYLEFVGRLRARHPGFNLTTDVIVGFPGERDEDFEATCRVCREVGFSHIHTFKYSRRAGTRADRMTGQIPETVKTERSERVRAISIENKRRFRSGLVGTRQTVLVEEILADGTAQGFGEHYVPVALPAMHLSAPSDRSSSKACIARPNTFHTVRITEIGAGDDPLLLASPAECGADASS